MNDELDSLREKRKRELYAQALKKELAEKEQEKIKQQMKEREVRAMLIVNNVLEPEAITYMNWLTQTNPPIAQTIRDSVILLLHKNLLRRKLTKVDIMRLERELTGQEANIRIKRRGEESMDLAEKKRKDKALENDTP